jgi:hypothetical protein
MRFWFSVALFAAVACAQDANSTFTPGLTGGLTKSEYEKNPSGWDSLIPANGDFKNWTRGLQSGSTALTVQSPWYVDPDTKHLICMGDKAEHEWLRYDREYKNFVFHVEWRFFPVAANPRYNSGVFVRNNATGTVWHQAQIGQDGGYIFAMTPVNGTPKRIDLKSERTENRIRPVGDWNTYEITAKADRLTLWVNGAVTSVMNGLEVLQGFVGLEAEGYKIEFRNVRIKELP